MQKHVTQRFYWIPHTTTGRHYLIKF